MLQKSQRFCYTHLEINRLCLSTFHVKALAGYVTTYLQTAANPKFIPNMLHSQLYKKHVLGEDVPSAPEQLPPYFSPELFSIMKKVNDESPLNIVNMSEKDWTRLLTEDFVTMIPGPGNNIPRLFTPCRAELASPATDWCLSWEACRQPGVPPELASFLWKMMLNLLCTQAKLHRMGTIRSADCKMQGCSETGTLVHELFTCSKNDGVGHQLLHCLQQYVPGIHYDAALRLEHGDASQDESLPLTLVTAITLQAVLKERENKTKVRSYRVRAELEQYINLLRTTRHTNTTSMLETMLNLLF